MQQADVAGDAEKVAGFLADDFKSYSGTTMDKDSKGSDKESFLKWVESRKEWVSYTSLTRHGEAYPDAIEYKDGKIWVQTWNYLKGVHDKTCIKIEMPVHNLYRLNDDNKIELALNYNYPIGNDIRAALSPRSNGTLYNEHEYINKVRRMFAAFEYNDMEKAYGFMADDASFTGLEMPVGQSINLEELKERNKKFLEKYTIESIDVVGYPDLLHYEIGDNYTVQSWWNFKLIRKSDKKKFTIPAMYTHDFNDEGMIERGISYISTKALDAK